ncbi:hypothetical protein F5890DRAFT_1477675 [Lentinula detonsa]|uniref:Uncharacterized protein n=1 Tax=Lentinula detonsa TaxID=2804962 RepID=A0AA38PSL6_9AGAR|nr:hypothetical protein F5890DRAFT_1477675 [Lentinula detonsa]
MPPQQLGSKSKSFKSNSVISDESDDAGVEKEREATPRGMKRKRMIKMITMGGKAPKLDGKRAKVEDDVYVGPTARDGERRFDGPGVAEQLAKITDQNGELVNIIHWSLVL